MTTLSTSAKLLTPTGSALGAVVHDVDASAALDPENQAVLHARSAFDPGTRRVLKRISLAGSRPF